MNQKLLLSLVAIPTLAGSMFTIMFMPLGAAAETIAPFQKDVLSGELNFCSLPRNERPSAALTPFLQKQSTIAVASEQAVDPSLEYPVLDFSEAESDAAVTLFGCDCPACINTLRQLQNQPLEQLVLRTQSATQGLTNQSQRNPNKSLLSVHEPIAQINASHSTQGHCWENLQRRATLEDVQNVLQTLEAEEQLNEPLNRH
jgi:hypothetical protein